MARNLTKQTRFSFGRFLSTKLDQQRLTEEISQELDEEERSAAPAIRYNVCRDRTASHPQKYQFPKSHIQEEVTKSEECEKDDLDSELLHNSPTESLLPVSGYRQFEASSTYKSLVLPLKASKLSDPFPSPVKMMPSHTVSDQEKADQMMAERKVPKSISRKK